MIEQTAENIPMNCIRPSDPPIDPDAIVLAGAVKDYCG